MYGTDHHEFDLNPEVELQSAIEDFAYYSDEPSADAGALPVWFLSRMSRQHVTVALSGEGADELFGGYLTYQADRLVRPFRRLAPAGLRRLMRGALDRYMPVSDEKISLEYKLKRWLEGSLLDPDEAHFFWNGTFSPEQLAQIRPGTNGSGLRRLVDELGMAPNGVLQRYLTVDQNYYLPDDILYKTDRMSMAHSLEVRPPFLDHRIVEFAAIAAATAEDPRRNAEVRAAGTDARQVAGDGAEAEEDGVRHTDPRLVPGRAAAIADGYGDAGGDRGDRNFRRARD